MSTSSITIGTAPIASWHNRDSKEIEHNLAVTTAEPEFLYEECEHDQYIKRAVEAGIIDSMGNKVTMATLDLGQFEEETSQTVQTALRTHSITFLSKFGMISCVKLYDLFLVALNAPLAELSIKCFQNFGSETISDMHVFFEKALRDLLPKIEITPFFREKAGDTDWRIVLDEPPKNSNISFWHNIEVYARAIIRKVAASKGIILKGEHFDIEEECNKLGIILDLCLPDHLVLRFIEHKIDLSIGRFKTNYLLKSTALMRNVDPSSVTGNINDLRACLDPSGLDLLQILLYHNYGIMVSDELELRNHKGVLQLSRKSISKGHVSFNGDFPVLLNTLLEKYDKNSKWSVILATKICNVIKGHSEQPVEIIIWKTLYLINSFKFCSLEYVSNITSTMIYTLWQQLPLMCFNEASAEDLKKRELFYRHPLYRLIVLEEIPTELVNAALSLAGLLSISLPGDTSSISNLNVVPTRHINNRPALFFQIDVHTAKKILFRLDFDLETTLRDLKQHKESIAESNKTEVLIKFLISFCPLPDLAKNEVSRVKKNSLHFNCIEQDRLLVLAHEWSESADTFFQIAGAIITIYLSSLGHSKAEEVLYKRTLPDLLRSSCTAQNALGQRLANIFLQNASHADHTVALFASKEPNVFVKKQWYLQLCLTGNRRLNEIATTEWIQNIQIEDEAFDTVSIFFDNVFIAAPNSALILLKEIALATLSQKNISTFFLSLWNKIKVLPAKHPFLFHWENTLVLADRYINSAEQDAEISFLPELYNKVRLTRNDLLPFCYFWLSRIPIQKHVELGISCPIEDLVKSGNSSLIVSIYQMASQARTIEEIANLVAFIKLHIDHPQIFHILQKKFIRKIVPPNDFTDLQLQFVDSVKSPIKFRAAVAIRYIQNKNANVEIIKNAYFQIIQDVLAIIDSSTPLLIKLLHLYSQTFTSLDENYQKTIKTVLTKLLENKHPLLDELVEIVCQNDFFEIAIEDVEFHPLFFKLLSYLLFQSERHPFPIIKLLVSSLYVRHPNKPFWNVLFKQINLLSYHHQNDTVLTDLKNYPKPSQQLKCFLIELDIDAIDSGSIETPPKWIELIQADDKYAQETLHTLKQVASNLLNAQIAGNPQACIEWLCLKKMFEIFDDEFNYKLLYTFAAKHRDASVDCLLWMGLEKNLENKYPSLVSFAIKVNSEWDLLSNGQNEKEKWERLVLIRQYLDQEHLQSWDDNVAKLLISSSIENQLSIFHNALFEKGIPDVLIPPFQMLYSKLLEGSQYHFVHLVPLATRNIKNLTFLHWATLLEYLTITQAKKDVSTLGHLWFKDYPFPSLERLAKIRKSEKYIHLSFMRRLHPNEIFQPIFFNHPESVLALLDMDEDKSGYETICINILAHLLKETNIEMQQSSLLISIRSTLRDLQSKNTLEIDLQLIQFSLNHSHEVLLRTSLLNLKEGLTTYSKPLTNSQKKSLLNLLAALVPHTFDPSVRLEVFHACLKIIPIYEQIWPEIVKWLIRSTDILFMHASNKKLFGEIILFSLTNISTHQSSKKSFQEIFSTPFFPDILNTIIEHANIPTEHLVSSLQQALDSGLIENDVLRKCLYNITLLGLNEVVNKQNATCPEVVAALNTFCSTAKSICDREDYPFICQNIVLDALFNIFILFDRKEDFLKICILFFNVVFFDPLSSKKNTLLVVQSLKDSSIKTRNVTEAPHNLQLFILLRLEFVNTLVLTPICDGKSYSIISRLAQALIRTLVYDFQESRLSLDQVKALKSIIIAFFYLPYPVKSKEFISIQRYMSDAFEEFSNIPDLFEKDSVELACASFFLSPGICSSKFPLHNLISMTIMDISKHADYQVIEFLERINTADIHAKLEKYSWNEIKDLIVFIRGSIQRLGGHPPIYLGMMLLLTRFLHTHSLLIPTNHSLYERDDFLKLHLEVLTEYIERLTLIQLARKKYTLKDVKPFLRGNTILIHDEQKQEFQFLENSIIVIKDYFNCLVERKLFINIDKALSWNLYNRFFQAILKLHGANNNIHITHALDDLILTFLPTSLFGELFLRERQLVALKCFQHILEHPLNQVEESHQKIANIISQFRTIFSNSLIFYLEWPKELHKDIPLLFHRAFPTNDQIMTVETTYASLNFQAAENNAKLLTLLYYQLLHWSQLFAYCTEKVSSFNKFKGLLLSSLQLFHQHGQGQIIHHLLSAACESHIVHANYLNADPSNGLNIHPIDSKIDLFLTEVLESYAPFSEEYNRFFLFCVNLGWFSNQKLHEKKRALLLKFVSEPKGETSHTLESLLEKHFHNAVRENFLSKWIYVGLEYYQGNTLKLFLRGAKIAFENGNTQLALQLLLDLNSVLENEEITLALQIISTYLMKIHLNCPTEYTSYTLERLVNSTIISDLLTLAHKSLKEEILFLFLHNSSLVQGMKIQEQVLWIKYYLQSHYNAACLDPSYHLLESVSQNINVLLKPLGNHCPENHSLVIGYFKTLFSTLINFHNILTPPQDKKYFFLIVLADAVNNNLIENSYPYISDEEYIRFLAEADPETAILAISCLSEHFPCSTSESKRVLNSVLLQLSYRYFETSHDYEVEKVLKYFLKNNNDCNHPLSLDISTAKLLHIMKTSDRIRTRQAALDTCAVIGIIDRDQLHSERLILFNSALANKNWRVSFKICKSYNLFSEIDCEVLILGLLTRKNCEDSESYALQTWEKFNRTTDTLLIAFTAYLRMTHVTNRIINQITNILEKPSNSTIQLKLWYMLWTEALTQIDNSDSKYYFRSLIVKTLGDDIVNNKILSIQAFQKYIERLYSVTLQYCPLAPEALADSIQIRVLFPAGTSDENAFINSLDAQLYGVLKLKIDWSRSLEKIFSILLRNISGPTFYQGSQLDHVLYVLILMGLKLQLKKGKCYTYLLPFIQKTFAGYNLLQQMKITAYVFQEPNYQALPKRDLFDSIIEQVKEAAPSRMAIDTKFNDSLHELLRCCFLHFSTTNIKDPYIPILERLLNSQFISTTIDKEIITSYFEDFASNVFNAIKHYSSNPIEFIRRYFSFLYECRSFLKTITLRRLLEKNYACIFGLLQEKWSCEPQTRNGKIPFEDTLLQINKLYHDFIKRIKVTLLITTNDYQNNLDLEHRVNALWYKHFDSATLCYFVYQLSVMNKLQENQKVLFLTYLFKYLVKCFIIYPHNETGSAIEDFFRNPALYENELLYRNIIASLSTEVVDKKFQEALSSFTSTAIIIEYIFEKENSFKLRVSTEEKFNILSQYIINFIRSVSWFRLYIVCEKLTSKFFITHFIIKKPAETFILLQTLLAVFEGLLDRTPCNEFSTQSLNKMKKPILNFCALNRSNTITEENEKLRSDILKRYYLLIDKMYVKIVVERTYPKLIPTIFKTKLDTFWISYLHCIYQADEATEKLKIIVDELHTLYLEELVLKEDEKTIGYVKTTLLCSINDALNYSEDVISRGLVNPIHNSVALFLQFLVKTDDLKIWVEDWLENEGIIRSFGEKLLSRDFLNSLSEQANNANNAIDNTNENQEEAILIVDPLFEED